MTVTGGGNVGVFLISQATQGPVLLSGLTIADGNSCAVREGQQGAVGEPPFDQDLAWPGMRIAEPLDSKRFFSIGSQFEAMPQTVSTNIVKDN